MYNKIMAAIDDSFATSKVLETAIDLAKRYRARMAICHALDVRIFAQREASIMLSNSMSEVEDKLRASAREFLERAASTVREAGVEVDIVLVESERDDESEMLAKAAADWQADLLVVGTHGRIGVERFFVGSVAKQLVGRVPTSLLLVRSS